MGHKSSLKDSIRPIERLSHFSLKIRYDKFVICIFVCSCSQHQSRDLRSYFYTLFLNSSDDVILSSSSAHFALDVFNHKSKFYNALT
jgi:hypothetical protein